MWPLGRTCRQEDAPRRRAPALWSGDGVQGQRPSAPWREGRAAPAGGRLPLHEGDCGPGLSPRPAGRLALLSSHHERDWKSLSVPSPPPCLISQKALSYFLATAAGVSLGPALLTHRTGREAHRAGPWALEGRRRSRRRPGTSPLCSVQGAAVCADHAVCVCADRGVCVLTVVCVSIVDAQ